MSESKYTSAYPLPVPVAIWIKKPWQTPRLTYISISNISAVALNNGHSHHFGLRNPQVLRNRQRLYGNIKNLLTLSPTGFTTLSKKSTEPATLQSSHYFNMSKNRSRISPLRFVAYSVTSVLLLPLFLIAGRENTKLNKVPKSHEPLKA